jgi:hypothetical protein
MTTFVALVVCVGLAAASDAEAPMCGSRADVVGGSCAHPAPFATRGNESSRADPARGSRKLRQIPAKAKRHLVSCMDASARSALAIRQGRQQMTSALLARGRAESVGCLTAILGVAYLADFESAPAVDWRSRPA